ncbi:hypothetical protein [Dyadobacter sp. CY343]|uniref:hypothetical protein n=1 Tax=Dyadobacter sp. CY343 TaxID=2907299 RepID=UPI001F3B976E|nr:hypothetical protein [Dyadobacter sp. CY343]MCE7060618.1 hypothetical protein [Dyadobacter sp. CY343]
MNIQQQIQRDIKLISENNLMQSQLFAFLQRLKVNLSAPGNIEQVLSHAGTIDNRSAEEVTQIINAEFGKIDSDWH